MEDITVDMRPSRLARQALMGKPSISAVIRKIGEKGGTIFGYALRSPLEEAPRDRDTSPSPRPDPDVGGATKVSPLPLWLEEVQPRPPDEVTHPINPTISDQSIPVLTNLPGLVPDPEDSSPTSQVDSFLDYDPFAPAEYPEDPSNVGSEESGDFPFDPEEEEPQELRIPASVAALIVAVVTILVLALVIIRTHTQ